MKPYFITCKEAMEARLLLQVRPQRAWPMVGRGVLGEGRWKTARVMSTCHAQVFLGWLGGLCVLCL